MILHKRKMTKKILATVSILFITVLFCISPCAVSRVYAAGSSDLSTQAVLSKSNFGTVKKVDKVYCIVDEFGNIIDTVTPTAGIDLDRYIGKQILVKDNLFVDFLESRQERSNGFFSGLREYLLGIVPRSKVVTTKPIDPIQTPPPVAVPMYAVYPVPVDPVVLDPTKPIAGDSSVIDKITIIQRRASDMKKLDRQGIKIAPELKHKDKPFQDGSRKK